MKRATGIIFACQNDDYLREITAMRTMCSVPFMGRYRVIDFLLSSLVNSGITNVGIITLNNYNSLMDHLGSGKEWDLNRKRDGLFILPPYAQKDSLGIYKGKVDAIASVSTYIKRSKEELCILCGTHTVSNMTYTKAIDAHLKSGADITILHNTEGSEYEIFPHDMILTTDEENKVTDISLGAANSAEFKLSMGIYIISKDLLLQLVKEAIAHNLYHFEKDVLLGKLGKLKIMGYAYDGYVARLNSVRRYFEHTMQLLSPEVNRQLFKEGLPVYTKVKDEVPSMFGDSAKVSNSMLADGCFVEGEIENCVLFRGVRVHKGAKLKNCIIMQHTEIMENASLGYVITDKEVIVREGRVLTGHESYPVVLSKGAVV